MAKREKTLFSRLSTLFRSGGVVKKKTRNKDTMIAVPDKTQSSAALLFQKSLSPTYATITANAYNLSERLMRYQDFESMEYSPEIAAALNLYADESVAQDENGRSLHVYSENEKIKELLENLYYDVLNIEFNLRPWIRNLVKFGDMFLLNDVSPEYGVIGAYPIPVNEIEREENYDKNDPAAVRFRWVSMGNRTLENWEITHFRLLGNDMFLPYGSSIIEPARRIWRQLILIEDAMLVYRVVRAPERRVFYIDVGNTPAENVNMYIEEQKKQLRTNQVVDRDTGRVDLRYNPLSVDEDYFIGVRGGESGTKIDTLQGGQNTAAIEDVAYIQKKLFAALGIPRAYLGFDEMLASKATLAQLDIRFSRTINVIQKAVLSELNKLAVIHLFAHGYDGEDLQNFTLHLSNPSSVAQQQKLELWRTKFEIAGSVPENVISSKYIMKNIWGLTKEEIREIREELVEEKQLLTKLENIANGESSGTEADSDAGTEDLFGDTGGSEPEVDTETPPPENAAEEPSELTEPGSELLTSGDEDDFSPIVFEDDKPAIKPMSQLQKNRYNTSRKKTGASKTHMPKLMSTLDKDNDITDREWRSSVVTNPLGESRTRMTSDMLRTLQRMSLSKKFVHPKKQTLTEDNSTDVQDDIDVLSENLNNDLLYLDEVDVDIDGE